MQIYMTERHKKWKKDPLLEKITRESDELAARHWSLAASDRENSYKKWLKCCEKAIIGK
mgnify:CR=1 FL=1